MSYQQYLDEAVKQKNTKPNMKELAKKVGPYLRHSNNCPHVNGHDCECEVESLRKAFKELANG